MCVVFVGRLRVCVCALEWKANAGATEKGRGKESVPWFFERVSRIKVMMVD